MMMKRILFTMVALFATNTVAVASDLDDGLAAYERQDYARAFEIFMRVATAPAPSLRPALKEFLEVMRPKASTKELSKP